MSEDANTGQTGGEGAAPAVTGDVLLGGTAPAGAGAAAGAGNGEAVPEWWQALSAEKPAEGKLSDAEWIKTKGYQTPADLLKAHRALETQLSSEKVPVPKDPNDAAAWDRLWKAAGRPDTPEGYKLDTIQGADAELLKGFAAEAHKMGLNQAQVERVAQYQMQLVQQQQEAITQRNQAERAALVKELGAQFEAETGKAAAAATALGIDGETAAKLRDVLGPKQLMAMLRKVASAIGEDRLEGAGQGGQMGQDLKAMQARKQEILTNPELQAKLRAKDPTLTAEWNAIIAAEADALKQQRAA